MNTGKLKVSSFTLLILQINKMIDSGKHDGITIREVYEHIESRDVLKWLNDIGGGSIDLSIFFSDTYGPFEALYANYLQNMAGGYAGDERRRWGVQTRGLCFLLAWTNEAIQQGEGWQPMADMFRSPAG